MRSYMEHVQLFLHRYRIKGQLSLCLTRSCFVVTFCTATFHIQQFYVLPTQCIYMFCVDLKTYSDYFPIQH